MSERKVPGNPFRYGREADVLVDRTEELARVVRVGEECGTLFLIGPRRFGKTSILRAAEAKLTEAGKVVLRYDAEAFDDIGSLAAALLSGLGDELLELVDDDERGTSVFCREPLDAVQDIREKRDRAQAGARLDADGDGDLAV